MAKRKSYFCFCMLPIVSLFALDAFLALSMHENHVFVKTNSYFQIPTQQNHKQLGFVLLSMLNLLRTLEHDIPQMTKCSEIQQILETIQQQLELFSYYLGSGSRDLLTETRLVKAWHRETNAYYILWNGMVLLTMMTKKFEQKCIEGLPTIICV